MNTNWLVLHPKAQKLAIAVITLVLGSALAVLNHTVTFNEVAISDVTAIIAMVIVYLSPSK